MPKSQKSAASYEDKTQESLQIVGEILTDVVDEVVDNISSDLIIAKAKENIATEVKRNPQKYLQRAIDENPALKDLYEELIKREAKLNFFKELKGLSYSLGRSFAKIKFGTGAMNLANPESSEDSLIRTWSKLGTKYSKNAFWEYFQKKYDKLSEEEKSELSNPYNGWDSQNRKIGNWMIRCLENIKLSDGEKLGSEESIKSFILGAETSLSQSAGENSEIDLLLQIRRGQGDLELLSQQVAELRFQNFREARRIVWASVGKKELTNEDGEVLEVSDFKYPGKTAAKTVYIPYHDIQQAIIDANWTLRAGMGIKSELSTTDRGRYTRGNYLTGHMLFVVSDQEHEKTRATGKYEGGRSFVDFPIALPLDLMTTQRIFSNQEAFENFLSSSGSEVGRNVYSSKQYSHSEWKLEEFLQDPENIRKIVQILKTKLTAKFGTADGHKVYELILFTNSNQNICDQHEQHEFGCEGKMWNIEASTLQGSFLENLTKEMQDQGLKTSSKHLPRILVSNTSFKKFDYYRKSSESLSQDAGEWLVKDQEWVSEDIKERAAKYEGLSIDAKKLAGKIILSSAERDIDGRSRDDELSSVVESQRQLRKQKVEEAKKAGIALSGVTTEFLETEYSNPKSVPFYSGFTSKSGTTNLLGYEKRRGKIETPQSFDGADLIEVRKKPSKSPSASDLMKLEGMSISGRKK